MKQLVALHPSLPSGESLTLITMALRCNGGMIIEPEMMLNMQTVWSSDPEVKGPKHLTLAEPGGPGTASDSSSSMV